MSGRTRATLMKRRFGLCPGKEKETLLRGSIEPLTTAMCSFLPEMNAMKTEGGRSFPVGRCPPRRADGLHTFNPPLLAWTSTIDRRFTEGYRARLSRMRATCFVET